MQDEKRYSLDEDTEELVELILNWAQDTAEIQKDDDVRNDMIQDIQELARRFQITQNIVTIDETELENGDVQLKIHVEREEPKKPKLRVVTDGGIVRNDNDDDDGGTVH